MTEQGTTHIGQEVPVGELAREIDRVAGIVSTAKTYMTSLHTGDPLLSLADRAARALEKFLDTLETLCPDQETGPDRVRWTTAACQSVRDFLAALRDAERDEPGSIPAAVLARAGAEVVRWDLVNRHVSDHETWVLLGDLFAQSYGEETQRVRGTSEAVAREVLRAVAYHAAALDQQTLKAGFAIARLIALLLPELFMTREYTEGALYGIDMAQRKIPVRLAQSDTFDGWWFITVEAADKLSDIHGELMRNQSPAGLEQMDARELRDAVVHLRRQWSCNPPMRRHTRFPLNVRMSVVRGYESAMNLLNGDASEAVATGTGLWRITDLSRGGVGAVTLRNIKTVIPAAGDLVAFCPEEGTRWHIGVVRRVRTTDTQVEIGIATLSSSPKLTRVDDGRVPRELFACDPVRPGGAIRLIAPLGTLGDNDPLFVVSKDAVVHKLRPLADALRGRSFDLRVYRVT